MKKLIYILILGLFIACNENKSAAINYDKYRSQIVYSITEQNGYVIIRFANGDHLVLQPKHEH